MLGFTPGGRMPEQQALAIARQLFETYFIEWNKANNEGLRKVTNYPFVAMRPNGDVLLAKTPAEFITDFVAMNHMEGWHHSSLDHVEVLNAESPAKILCLVTYSRYKQDGKKYMAGRTFYLLTNLNNHWGIQVRWVMSQKNA
jgi:hypothetical protein